MKLAELKNKKILILGLGKEGIDAFRFLRRLFPNKILAIADRDKNLKTTIPVMETRWKMRTLSSSPFKVKSLKLIKWHLGDDYLKSLKNYDVIIKSPGVPIHLPEIERVYKCGKIVSPTQIFFDNCPGKIVGVTATKGKSTTTALIYKILKEGGIKAHLVGNIGKPALRFLPNAKPEDVYVYELSCHQLYRIEKSPNIAVFLNIYPEHLDYYRNFKEYFVAKKNITKYQAAEDYFIFNKADAKIGKIKTRAKKIAVDAKNVKKIIDARTVSLKGDFNLINIAAALEVGKIFGIPPKNIQRIIKNFKPLPHRLELVGTYRGIKFYDDSLSTIPESAMAALDALGKNVQTIILGGHDRNLDFTKLAKKILRSKVNNVILFPTTGYRIWQKIVQLSKCPAPNHFFANDMAQAVKFAYSQTEKEKICLLSTASPSFGIFRNYAEKAKLFRKYIKKFARSDRRVI